jgi:hypothetical protein
MREWYWYYKWWSGLQRWMWRQRRRQNWRWRVFFWNMTAKPRRLTDIGFVWGEAGNDGDEYLKLSRKGWACYLCSFWCHGWTLRVSWRWRIIPRWSVCEVAWGDSSRDDLGRAYACGSGRDDGNV